MLVSLDEGGDVFVPLEPGPCAGPTVTRFERVEVTTGTSHACSGGGGGGTNQDATRETRTERERETLCVCTDVPRCGNTNKQSQTRHPRMGGI